MHPRLLTPTSVRQPQCPPTTTLQKPAPSCICHSPRLPTIHPLPWPKTASSTYLHAPPPPFHSFINNTHIHRRTDTQTLTHPLATHQSILSLRCRPSLSLVGVSPATTASPVRLERVLFSVCFGFLRINGHALLCWCWCLGVCMNSGGTLKHVIQWKCHFVCNYASIKGCKLL